MDALLEKNWRELAGKSSQVAMRPIIHGPDEDLIGQLSSFEIWFRTSAQSAFYERFFRDQSTASAQVKRWAESRRALIAVLKPLYQQGVDPSRILMSISHTQQQCIAISALRGESQALGAGVDLESSDRFISVRASERFFRFEEKALGLSALHAWTLKEACYKADPGNENTLIPHYQITSLNASDGEARSVRNSEIAFKMKLVESNGSLIAFSLANKI